MRRRQFLALLGSVPLARSQPVLAQAAIRTYRVGLFNRGAPITDKGPFGAALLRGLNKRGYVVGPRQLVLHVSWVDSQFLTALGHQFGRAAMRAMKAPQVPAGQADVACGTRRAPSALQRASPRTSVQETRSTSIAMPFVTRSGYGCVRLQRRKSGVGSGPQRLCDDLRSQTLGRWGVS